MSRQRRLDERGRPAGHRGGAAGRVVAKVALALLVGVGLGMAPGPAHAAQAEAQTPAPPISTQLGQAPWYDAEGDTWRRVVPEAPPPEDEGDAGAPGDGIPGFAYVMYALVALAIILLAVQLWRRRGGWGTLDRGPRAVAAPATVAALPFQLPAPDQDPEAALRAALAAGDLAQAVIWLYALQLLRLDAAGVIRLGAGKTNRSYVRETGSALPAAAGPLGATVAVFERSHFGHQAPARAEVDDLLAHHNTLLAALPISGAAP